MAAKRTRPIYLIACDPGLLNIGAARRHLASVSAPKRRGGFSV